MIRRSDLIVQLRDLGVAPGDVLLVHTSFSKVGGVEIEDGPRALIDALLAAIGPSGTLVMPSMSDDDDHPFDRARSSCLGMGIVAETFRQLPGVLRSDSPHAFAAAGPLAALITAPHPLEVPHGLDSPVGRVYEHDGLVLLIGVNHDSDTTVHLAETLAGVRYRRPKYAMVLRDGEIVRRDYDEIDHCCDRFKLAAEWLESRGEERRGGVGRAEARLARSRHIVEAVMAQLSVDDTVFLHPPGVCLECDEARASLPV